MSKLQLPAWANHGPIKTRNTQEPAVLRNTGGVTRNALPANAVTPAPAPPEEKSATVSGPKKTVKSNNYKLGQAAYMRAYRARKKAEAE